MLAAIGGSTYSAVPSLSSQMKVASRRSGDTCERWPSREISSLLCRSTLLRAMRLGRQATNHGRNIREGGNGISIHVPLFLA
jgi:hypothetical protein